VGNSKNKTKPQEEDERRRETREEEEEVVTKAWRRRQCRVPLAGNAERRKEGGGRRGTEGRGEALITG